MVVNRRPAVVTYEWPMRAGYQTVLVKVSAKLGATRTELNELAAKRLQEMGYETVAPFFDADPSPEAR